MLRFLIRRCGLPMLAVLAIPCYGQTYSLTGMWQDDAGGKYRIRHVGNTIAWVDDAAPAAINVFIGTINGNMVGGQWVDVPGGQIQQTGTLMLRVESNDRMVKTGSTIAYGGSVLTRVGGAATPPVPPQRSAPCSWNSTEEGWTMIWTQRGNSNVFDVRGQKGGASLSAVHTVRLQGNRASVTRAQASDGNNCEMEGTVGADGASVSGTYRCLSGGPYQWQGRMSGNCSALR